MTWKPSTWDAIAPRVDALLRQEITRETAYSWLQEWSTLTAELQEEDARIQRAISEDTADREAEKRFLFWIESIIPEWERADQVLKKKFLAVPDLEIPPEMAPTLKRFRTEVALFREENVPIQSELLKLGNRYDQIVGALSVEWEGKEITLPQAEVLLENPDRATRAGAWRAIMDQYLEERQSLNDLYLEMLHLRRKVAQNAGFENYREYRWQAMGRFDYTPESCFALHDAIEAEVVPFAEEVYEQHRVRLGVNRLRPWDLLANPYGTRLVPFEETSELEEGAQRIFNRLDPVLGEYFAGMRDGFLDLESRPNKAPGGYCSSLPVTGRPYIFMNAAGTNDDVFTMMHEGGHAFHFMESKDLPLIWYTYAPMEFCEVASMTMELLSAPYLTREQGGFYSDRDARRAYAQRLREIVTFLPYMSVVDSFQHWVYVDAPEEVTPDAMDARWSELWDRFMPGIDYSGYEREKETGWHRKPHIFSSPFYYIEYGLAQLGALQIWRNALDDQAGAIRAYRDAMALGGTRDLPSLFERAGATFLLDRERVASLMRLIREQLSILEETLAAVE